MCCFNALWGSFNVTLWLPEIIHLFIFILLSITLMGAAEGSCALFMRHSAQRATSFPWDVKTAHTTFCLWSLSCTQAHTHTHACVWPICCCWAGQNHGCLSMTSAFLCDARRAACWLCRGSVLCGRRSVIVNIRVTDVSFYYARHLPSRSSTLL